MSSIEIPNYSQKKAISTLVDGILIPTPEGIKVYEKGEWKLLAKAENWNYKKALDSFLGLPPARRNKEEEK